VYREKQDYYQALLQMTEGHDLKDPFGKVPISVYNQMCDWVENNIGKVNTKKVGRQIGKTAFEGMVNYKLITDKPTPRQVMDALAVVADQMIQDPKKRGWKIMAATEKSILMRRTQTFNSSLQFGLLETLIYKSGAISPSVEYAKSVAAGDAYDEYLITWK